MSGDDIVAWVGMYMWPFFRILGMLSIAPVIGSGIIPTRIRLGLAVVFAMLIAPLLPTPLATSDIPMIVLITAQQFLVGVAMGFLLRMVFAALELGGQVIALQMGLGFAALIDPQGGVQVPTLSQFYVMMATLLFLALNGHHALLQLLFDSFRLLPVGPIGINAEGFAAVAAWGSRMFQGAVLVALTATIALVSVNVLMGVMTRAVPQFNMFVAFPAILLLGFLIIALNMTSLQSHLVQLMDNALVSVRNDVLARP